MIILDTSALVGLAAVLASVSSLVWAIRRKRWGIHAPESADANSNICDSAAAQRSLGARREPETEVVASPGVGQNVGTHT